MLIPGVNGVLLSFTDWLFTFEMFMQEMRPAMMWRNYITNCLDIFGYNVGWKWVIPFLIHLTISVTWSSMKLFAVSVVAMERGIFPVVFQLNIITFSNTTTCWESRGKWRERQIITKVSYSLLFVVDNRKCKATWFHSKGNTVCFPEKQRPLAVCAHAYMVKLIQ